MEPSLKADQIARINMEIMILREDANRVSTPSLRIQILNMIAQKETRLNLLRLKSMGHTATDPARPTARPSARTERTAPLITDNERPDPLRKSTKVNLTSPRKGRS